MTPIIRNTGMLQAACAFAFCAAMTATVRAADNPSLEALIGGAHRSEANKARNIYRHPLETLNFFGVKPESTVVEIWPGGGWYTEVLAPYLKDHGRYVAAFPANAPRSRKAFDDKLAQKPELFSKVAIMPLAAPGNLNIRPDGGADVVLTFRNVHNWIEDGNVDAFFGAFFAALKPGGVLGVVEHRAKAGTTLAQSKESGYMTEDYVIERATAAGFKLDAKSEINANPKDTKDYAKGVWTLPPVLTNGATDREKYLAIGESDRMTLRFVKPRN